MPPDRPLAFIDALRGYAVTLVIASHAFPLVPELPWTVKRFSNLGFFGVQLFFVVSCFTLARSWRQRAAVARPSLRAFLLRRLFRIAPAYWLAALFYAWLRPGPFDATRVVTLASFTNGWSPAQMPTIPGVWEGVPGGWSIAAEFAFYAAFPLMIVALRGTRPVALALLASLPLAWLANSAGWSAYAELYGDKSTDQFLYYWLPNQIPVFLCGLLLHESLHRVRAKRAEWSLCAGLLLFAALAYLPLSRLPMPESGFIDSPLLAAVAFALIAAALALRPIPWIANAAMVRLGQASFSAYLLHFAVLDGLQRLLPGAVLSATGVTAAACGLAVFVVALAITFAVAQATYRLVELPAIGFGGRLIVAAARRSRC